MTVTAAPPAGFDVGRVMSSGLGLLARRPIPILLLALALGYLPAVAEGWATAQLGGSSAQDGVPRDLGASLQRLGLLEGVFFLAAGFRWVLHSGIAVVAIADAVGRREEILGQLMRMLTRSPVIFVGGIAAALGIFLATLLLIVPGILLSLAWMVGPAVAGVEGRGFMDIFRRSAELTRGNRGALFGITLAFGAVGVALSFGLRLAVGVPVLADGPQPALFTFLLQPMLTAVLAAAAASVNAAAYLELRGVKEGFAGGGVASVFD